MFTNKTNLTLFKERLRELKKALGSESNKAAPYGIPARKFVCPEKDEFIIDELQKLWEIVDDIQNDFDDHVMNNHAKKDYGY